MSSCQTEPAMIEAEEFVAALRSIGHDFVSGVPCSFLKPLINRVIDSPDLDYVGAASEGEAVGISLGAYLAGRKTVTLCQNSGLGNTVNPLTSLNFPFRIPTLLITTWRGEPGRPDEPQHELMGEITTTLLETLRIPWQPFPESTDAIAPCLAAAGSTMEDNHLPFAFVMRKGNVAPCGLETSPDGRAVATERFPTRLDIPSRERPSRAEVLERLLELVPPSAAIIATTGKTGRELFTLADRPQHLYVVGGMGTASAIGLGVARNAPDRPIIVIDGDGAALMKLGTFATIGAQQPPNLIHLVLDNEVHDSTGGQATVSPTVRFAEVAAACNYRRVAETDHLADLTEWLPRLLRGDGPTLLHLKIRPGSLENLGRPTVSPVEVKERFMAFLQS